MKGTKDAAMKPTEEAAIEIAEALAVQVANLPSALATLGGRHLHVQHHLRENAGGEELSTATTSCTLIATICAVAARAPVSHRRPAGWLYL